jgi:tRNA (guanine37-N1)-methyltransferase
MRIDILTLFPEMFSGPLTESLLSKAREKGLLNIELHDIRSFTTDKHHTADDRSFGGGPGMVMKVEPIHAALKSLGVTRKTKTAARKARVIYLSPQGTTLDQPTVRRLAGYERLVLLCGHYEGVDERALNWVDEEISIGDYVLTGGELPAMVLIDAVSRLVPGVVKEASSVAQDSFFNGLLDHSHYTRPAEFKGYAIPDVLLSGNHALVEKWRREQVLLRTLERRPDLLKKVQLTAQEKQFLAAHKKRRQK